MAVYTAVEIEDLFGVLDDFSLGLPLSMNPIAEGVENTNYLLRTDRGRFILTLFEKRTNPADLPYFIALMRHLNAAGIPCPMILQNKAGQSLFTLNDKPAVVASFLEGRPKNVIDAAGCFKIGAILAKMHQACASFEEKRETTLPYDSWSELIGKVGAKAETLEPGLFTTLRKALDDVRGIENLDLPKGALHADLFPDNVFFLNDEVSGVIDFYFAYHGFFVYDIMLTLNAWCGADGNMDRQMADSFLRGYESIRPLTADEIDALPLFGKAAAIRIVATRLYDWFNTDDAALVKKKNPLDHVRLLDFHANGAFYRGQETS